jgi:hypothetical protein
VNESSAQLLTMRLTQLEEERDMLEEHCRQQDIELERLKLQLTNVREDRDKLKRKVRVSLVFYRSNMINCHHWTLSDS